MVTDKMYELQGWKQVKPDDAIHLWEAPEDPSETATVPSDWYEHNGTPMTKCGLDMSYSGTYVKELK